MIEGILGGIAGLAGAAAQAQSAQMAAMIQWMNLQFQKQNAAKQHRVATAGRTDAYGNKQQFDDIMNEWETILTPTQQKLVKGGEKEQLLSLTEDAPRNRAIRKAQRERGIEAGKDYYKELNEFRYGEPRSEAAIRDELTNLIAGSKAEKARGGQAELIRTALRQNKGADISSIIQATNNDIGSSLATTMLEARDAGMKESAARKQQHIQEHIPIMQQLMATMDAGGDMPVRFSDTPDKLMALQSEQMKGIMQALTNEGSQVGGAYNNYANAVAKTAPDLKAIASLMGGIGKAGGGSRSGTPSYSLMGNEGGYTETPELDRLREGYGDY